MKQYMGVYHKDTDRLYICCESTSLELCEYYVAKCPPDPDDLPTTLCSSDFGTDWQYIAITESEPIEENALPKGIAEYLKSRLGGYAHGYAHYDKVYHKATNRLYICGERLFDNYVVKCKPDDLPTDPDLLLLGLTKGEPIKRGDLPKYIVQYFEEKLAPHVHYRSIYHKATDRVYICRHGHGITYYAAKCNPDDLSTTDSHLLAITEGEPIEENDLPKDIAQYFYELNHHRFDWDWIYHKATDRLYISRRHGYPEKINFCVVKFNPDDRPTRTNLLLLGLTKGEPIKRNDLPIIVDQYFRELKQDILYYGIYYKPTDRLYICRISTSLELCEYYVAKCNPDDLPTGLCGSPVDADWKYIVINEGKPIEENDLPKGIAQFLRESVQPIVYEWIYHKPTGHLYIGRFELDRGYPQKLTLHVVKCNRVDLPTTEPYYRLLAITKGEPIKINDLPVIVYQYFRDRYLFFREPWDRED